MRTVEEIQRGLQGRRLEVVAAETGMAFNTVRNYATGVVKRPLYLYQQALNDWLDKQEEAEAATDPAA